MSPEVKNIYLHQLTQALLWYAEDLGIKEIAKRTG